MAVGRKTNVGVVGLGQWGKHHARIYAGLPDVNLVGVVDLAYHEARSFAHRYKTESFNDHRKLIGRVDAVSVVVPTALHFEVARDFLNAGVHVLVEKPMTTTTEEAADLVRLADQRELMLLVGHVERFKPAVRRLVELAKEPVFIQTRRMRPYDASRVMDVGVVLDLMIHDIDIVLSITGGRVVEIEGMGVRIHNAHEDLAVAKVKMASGCVAWLMASRVSAEKVAEIEVTTADRSIRLDYHRQQITIHPFGGETERMLIRGDEPLRAELRHFMNCVQGLERPLVTGEAGLRALEITLDLTERMAVVMPPVRV